MTKLQMLLELFSARTYKRNYLIAKATKICIRCGKPGREFRDDSARLEYPISALCQSCQDEGLNSLYSSLVGHFSEERLRI
jgi:hypothetical protein